MNTARSHKTPLVRSIASKRLLFATAMLLLFNVTHALAQAGKTGFKFVNVIDSTQGLNAVSQFPAINNQGAVAYVATSTSGQVHGVFRWDQGSITTIASDADNKLISFGDDVAINARGVVGFGANFKDNPTDRALFTSDGLVTKTIVDAKAQGLISRFLGSPSINDLGTVAFDATRKDFSRIVLKGNGEELATVVDTAGGRFSGFSNVGVNNAGKIAFVGFGQDGTQQVFIVASPGEFISVTDKDPFLSDPYADFGDPVINAAGTVADEVFLSNGNLEVFTGNGTGTTARTDPNSSFFTFAEHPSLNNRGAVAFFANELSGGQGIFVVPTGGTSPIAVIEAGDELFGSTVIGLDLGRFALNDRTQLVFHYNLRDGRSGVAIASLNEPVTEGDGNDR